MSDIYCLPLLLIEIEENSHKVVKSLTLFSGFKEVGYVFDSYHTKALRLLLKLVCRLLQQG